MEPIVDQYLVSTSNMLTIPITVENLETCRIVWRNNGLKQGEFFGEEKPKKLHVDLLSSGLDLM